jgi:hypothetical protein
MHFKLYFKIQGFLFSVCHFIIFPEEELID